MVTLDQEFAKYRGQSLLVPGAAEADRGQCVQWADYVIKDVYGLDYVWANAIDWWNKFDSIPQLKNNFVKVTDGSIKKGDFVIFNDKVGSEYGHIDVAMADGMTNQFTGADSNWGGNKTVHLVYHSGSEYVIGALRRKGTNMSTDALSKAQIQVMYGWAMDVAPEKTPNFWTSGFTGKSLDSFLNQLKNDPTYKKHVQNQGKPVTGYTKQNILDLIDKELS